MEVMIKYVFMQNIYFTEDKVSLCDDDKCINVNSDLAKGLTFGFALIFVVSIMASLVESSK